MPCAEDCAVMKNATKTTNVPERRRAIAKTPYPGKPEIKPNRSTLPQLIRQGRHKRSKKDLLGLKVTIWWDERSNFGSIWASTQDEPGDGEPEDESAQDVTRPMNAEINPRKSDGERQN